MSKNQGSYIGALKVTVANLTSDKLALQTALDALGYCHEQQTKFITDSMSGADGAISKDLLLQESKAALAEAIETNKRLTEDADFQAHRYTLQSNRLAQTARCAADTSDRLRATERRLEVAYRVVGGLSLTLLAGLLGTAVHALEVVL